MKNKNTSDFLQAMTKHNKELLNNYKPKYKVGDVIKNDKFKVISIITGIYKTYQTFRDEKGHSIGQSGEKVLHYVLKDLENKAAQQYFGKMGMQLNKEERKRWRPTRGIDHTYHKIDPVKAQLLFGKEIIDLREKYMNEKYTNN